MQKKITIGIIFLFFLSLSLHASSSATKNIIKNLTQYGNAQKYGFRKKGKLSHKILYSYDFNYQDKKSKLIVASTNLIDKGDSHVDAPKMSFFISTNNKLVLSDINAFFAGQWGDAPSKEDFKPVQLGKNNFGFIFKSFGSGQGWFEETISIYYPMEGQFKLIFIFDKSLDNGGTSSPIITNWTTQINYKNNNNSWYDISTHKKGVESNNKINTTEYYQFNGKKYVKSQNMTSNMDTNSFTLKESAYMMMRGEYVKNPKKIIIKTNSKNIKIYCLSNMSMCKTESEVKAYAKGH